MAILSGQTTPFTSFLPQPNKLILMLVFTLAPILLSEFIASEHEGPSLPFLVIGEENSTPLIYEPSPQTEVWSVSTGSESPQVS